MYTAIKDQSIAKNTFKINYLNSYMFFITGNTGKRKNGKNTLRMRVFDDWFTLSTLYYGFTPTTEHTVLQHLLFHQNTQTLTICFTQTSFLLAFSMSLTFSKYFPSLLTFVLRCVCVCGVLKDLQPEPKYLFGNKTYRVQWF